MMRKIFVALLVGALAVGLAVPASAADLKFTGAYRTRFMWDDNLNCFGAAGAECSGNTFQARFRPRFDVETEGGVRGVLWLEIGDITYGNIAQGGDADTDGINVETKQAYIDFPIPATPLRLRSGLQGFATSKNLALDMDAPGLSIYGKLGEVDTKLYWTRWNDTTSVDANGSNAQDGYGLDLTFSPTKDLSLNAYGFINHNSQPAGADTSLDGYWFGLAAGGKVDSVRWDIDFVYGSVDTSATTDQSGYLVFGSVGMPLAGTPFDLELRGWYATGADSATGDSDAFPIIFGAGPDTGAQIWSGSPAIDISDPADTLQNSWAIGLVARYTFSPSWRITANVHYIGTVEEGTSTFASPVGNTGGLAGVDSVGTEVGMRHDLTIARGLVFTLTMGRLFIGDDTSTTGTQFHDVTKFAGVLNYAF